MRFFLDFLPLLVFFGTYAAAGIFVATAAAMAVTVVQVLWAWFKHRKVDRLLWVNFAAIMIFGGLTLFLQDKRFIMVKPTIVYWLISASLAFSYVVLKKNPIRLMMDSFFDAPDALWRRWFWIWLLFFFVLGGINLLVAYGFSEEVWVKFKVFGVLGLCMFMTFVQIWRLMPYAKDTGKSDP